MKTDAPEHQQFNLTLRGFVQAVADISPGTVVHMSGIPGEELISEVTITPLEKFNFSILDIRQELNTGIRTQLIKPDKKNERTWKIQIKSKSYQVEKLYDIITLTTDRKICPMLKIKVYVNFNRPDKNPKMNQGSIHNEYFKN